MARNDNFLARLSKNDLHSALTWSNAAEAHERPRFTSVCRSSALATNREEGSRPSAAPEHHSRAYGFLGARYPGTGKPSWTRGFRRSLFVAQGTDVRPKQLISSRGHVLVSMKPASFSPCMKEAVVAGCASVLCCPDAFCARAASGQVVAPPSAAMNSRRRRHPPLPLSLRGSPVQAE